MLRGLADAGVPRIHFGVGHGELLGAMGEAGADVVGVDWRTPLDVATARIGPDKAVQGNLDPCRAVRAVGGRRAEVRRVLAEGRAAPGHVFNLGHGVLPETDPDVLTRVVELVHEAVPAVIRVAVVGGGIAGLAAAVHLRGRAQVTVYEQSAVLGGKLRTGEIAGSTVELGAEAFLVRDPAGGDSAAVALARRLGLGDDLVNPATGAAAIAVDGRLVPMPKGTLVGVPGDLDAVSALAKPDPARDADEGHPLLAPGADVAVGDLVRRRLGDEVVDRLVDPMLGGVYAGRADRLSLAATMPALAARGPHRGDAHRRRPRGPGGVPARARRRGVRHDPRRGEPAGRGGGRGERREGSRASAGSRRRPGRQAEAALGQRRQRIALGQPGVDEAQPGLLDAEDLARLVHLGAAELAMLARPPAGPSSG